MAEGTLDTAFDTLPKGAVSQLEAIAIQSDGKLLIAGSSFFFYNGVNRSGIARVNLDGTLDTTFNPGTGAGGGVYTIAIQPSDGKILIGGTFTSYNGIVRNKLARINTDGSLDTTFNPAGGPNFTPFALAVQADGKIMVGGNFTTYNGTNRRGIARINADGSLDTTFNPSNGVAGGGAVVYGIAIQPADQKILIVGDFTSYYATGNSRNRIARINTDGTLDTTFTVGTGANNVVRAIALQSDGKIVIGGDFSNYAGTPRDRVARITLTGGLDGTFTTPSGGANGLVRCLAIQPSNGRIVIGGTFTTYAGVSRNRIARLLTDGSLDGTFFSTTGADSAVYGVAIQPVSGMIYIAGLFENYEGNYRKSVAGINPNSSIDPIFNPGLQCDHGHGVIWNCCK